MMAAVCFPPNDEPEGNRFMENLEVGRYYVLQAYTVGESRRSPMTNNMADSVTLDWRTPIEEVPFEKIRVNTKISVEQRGFNHEFQEAEERKVKERRRDPGLFEKRMSLEDGQRTVDSFVTVSQRVDREEDEQKSYGGRDLSREGEGSTGRGRRSPERSRNPLDRWRSTSRERGRSPRRDRIRSITRERSTLKNSSRASRSRTKSVSRSRTKSVSRSRSKSRTRSRSRARSASVDTNPRLDESSEDSEEDNENEEKEEDTQEKEDEDSDEKDDGKGTEEDDDKEGDEEDENEGERVVEESDSD